MFLLLCIDILSVLLSFTGHLLVRNRSCFQVVLQLQNRIWDAITNGAEFSIAIFCDFYKAVTIVTELSFIAIGEYLCNCLPTPLTPAMMVYVFI